MCIFKKLLTNKSNLKYINNSNYDLMIHLEVYCKYITLKKKMYTF